jgi:hypothetical protein
MHAEVKGMLVLFGCSVGSYCFNVLLVLLLSNIASVRHAKAKGMLLFFGCTIGSCHVYLCSNCRHGALTNIVVACVMHDEAKGLLFFYAVLSHVILMFC